MSYFQLLDGQRKHEIVGKKALPVPIPISEMMSINHLILEYDTEETLSLLAFCDRITVANEQ